MKNTPYARSLFASVLIFLMCISLVACGGPADETEVEEKETASLTLAADTPSIVADGGSSAPIMATLIDSSGNPVSKGISLSFSTTLGTFPNGGAGYTVTTPDDTGIVTVSLISGTVSGIAQVTCTSNGVTQRVSVTFTQAGGGDETAWIRLSASPESVPALSAATLTAELYDSDGQSVPSGTSVSFSTTLGTFPNGDQHYTMITTDNLGKLLLSLRAGDTPGYAEVTCESDDATQRVEILFTGSGPLGEAAWIQISATPDSIPAFSSATLDVALYDSSGEAVPSGTPVTFSTSLGTFPNGNQQYNMITTDTSGKVSLSLRAGAAPGNAEILCTSGNASQAAAISFTGGTPQGETAWIFLSASPDSIPADSLTTSVITATLYDSLGQPVSAGTDVSFSTTSSGSFSNGDKTFAGITLTASGTAQAVLHPGAETGPADVICTSNGISQTLTVHFTGEQPAWIDLVASPGSIPADGASSASVTAILTDSAGRSVPMGTQVTFSTPSSGTFLTGTDHHSISTPDDSGRVTVSLRAGTIPGPAEVICEADGVSQMTSVFFTQEGPAGETAWISLSADPGNIPADGITMSNLTATLYDSSGRAIPAGTSVVFTTSLGTFLNGSATYTMITLDDSGKVQVPLRAGTVPGYANVTCEAHGIQQQAQIIFTDDEAPGEAAWITLTADPETLPADGESQTLLTATLYDSSGQPVSKGTGVTFSTTLGSFPNNGTRYTFITLDDSGKLTIPLKAPDMAGQTEVSCTSGRVQQKLTVVFSTEVPAGETAWIVMNADPRSIAADGVSTSTITATLYDRNGEPVSQGTSASFHTTSTGRFANGFSTYTMITTDDSGTVTASLRSGTTSETATVTCTSDDIVQWISIEFGGSATTDKLPAVISVTADTDVIRPGGTTDVEAVLYDSSGAPVPGVQVFFSLDDPTLAYISGSATTSVAGVARVSLTARSLPGQVGITAYVGDISNTSPKIITILDESAPNDIVLTINPNPVTVLGTATVTAEVSDVSGNHVANGTDVVFRVNNELYGSISPMSVTNSGKTSVTFEAGSQPGIATITANSGAASVSAMVTIDPAPAAAIEFLSAEPDVIAIRESGGNETSTIRFVVKDSNGEPLDGVNVSLLLDGPNGGEYIKPPDMDAIDVSTDNDGIAQVILHSGYVAGPVTVTAAIDVSDTEMSVRSSVVSIGGGVPSAKRISAASTILNLPGLRYANKMAELTTYLADRFGNYNVLKGTTVSFASEMGLTADTSMVTLDEGGTATVTIRTQGGGPEDVEPMPWELDLQDYLRTVYALDTSAHPRDGLCSVLIYTKGEEHFDDSNANGRYDLGETFLDTYDDPFGDYNDNGLYDDLTSVDPEELYIDASDDGQWNGISGDWDASKYLFANFPILITGSPVILSDSGTFEVADGGAAVIRVLVCDQNLNPLIAGSSVTISTNKGQLAGNTGRIYSDSSLIGPSMLGHLSLIEYVFEIYDAEPATADAFELATITVSVEWDGGTYEGHIVGTVPATTTDTTTEPKNDSDALCQGCCSSHGSVVCNNGVTECGDGSALSQTCIDKGCDICE